MRQLVLLALGCGCVYYVTEYMETKTALMIFGLFAVGSAVGADNELKEIKRQLSAHAKKIFPSSWND